MSNAHTFPARRLRALAAALAIAAIALLTTAATASATEQRCHYDGVSFNACLRFEWAGYGWYTGHVGLDLNMPEQYAREIIGCGATFQASLWGEDGATDQFIRPLQIKPGWPTVGPGGISSEWHTLHVIGPQLDEDPGENRDELYARIEYIDCHRPGQVQRIDTGMIVGDWRYSGF